MIRKLALLALPLAALSTASAETAAPVATPEFLTAAAASDQFEIQEGKLAASRGSPAIKTFGERMVRDHTKTSNEMMAAAKKAGMAPPPPVLRADQQNMIAQLQGLSGADFDRTYVTQQIQAHKDALALVSNYAKTGDTPAIKAVAQQAEPVVKMHLDMLEKMQK